MWNKPWKLTEGFLIGGGLVVVGLLLQISVGGINWEAFAFPVNIVLLAVYWLAMMAMYALRGAFMPFASSRPMHRPFRRWSMPWC